MASREQIASFARRLQSSRDRLLSIPLSWLVAVVLPPLAITALVLLATFHFLRPLPPRSLSIAVGNPRGSYAAFAGRYRKTFQAAGIALKIIPTEGAADTLALLRAPGSGLDAAMLQDGLAESGTPGLRSMGAIGYEPIWIFYQGPEHWSRLSDLAGKRINIGRWGAGTQPFAIELLREGGLDYNVEAFTPPGHDIQISTLSALEALERLKSRDLDAAITLGDPDSPTIQAFFHTPGIHVMPIAQADAIARHRPFLHHVRIPRGGIDLHTGLPEQDLDTLATTSVVYVREDLHPALVTLLASAMADVHQEGTLLQNKHEFPADLDVTLPPHPGAVRYFRNGPPFLQRYLPFWLAALLDRTLVVLVPLLALVVPASRLIPQLYAWRMKRRLDRWYAELKFLDGELDRDDSVTDRSLLLERISWIEQQLALMRLPIAFANQLYILKEHLELVRRRILRLRRTSGAGAAPAQATGAEPGVLAD